MKEKQYYILKIKDPKKRFSIHFGKKALHGRYKMYCEYFGCESVSFYRLNMELSSKNRFYQKLNVGSI
jgi:hypothetical protein